ncbi:hypothetical protein [Jeotgalibacillus campisalis]|uniref:Uncharacterized protein n=1 Tax=Jeotgalibacillus campisalis TaxID=220754 RepID=A0A0C2VPM3_9BACL|nr:hypothetical protein [Jeotgalibacillus campisalis]KIL50862.1 hypothetical protein KR50_07430 [Jeotgalibacillus campisalis]
MNKSRMVIWSVFACFGLAFLVIYLTGNENAENIEAQLKERQGNFDSIIKEKETSHGMLVFYTLRKEERAGIGLALFKEESEGNWVYQDGTAHLSNLNRRSFLSDYIEIDEEIKVVYGYVHDSSILDMNLVKEMELENDTLMVSDSHIAYTFVEKDKKVKIQPVDN